MWAQPGHGPVQAGSGRRIAEDDTSNVAAEALEGERFVQRDDRRHRPMAGIWPIFIADFDCNERLFHPTGPVAARLCGPAGAETNRAAQSDRPMGLSSSRASQLRSTAVRSNLPNFS